MKYEDILRALYDGRTGERVLPEWFVTGLVVGANIVGRVINPGDPDWIPSATFVPPPNWSGWAKVSGWRFDPTNGWRRGSW